MGKVGKSDFGRNVAKTGILTRLSRDFVFRDKKRARTLLPRLYENT